MTSLPSPIDKNIKNFGTKVLVQRLGTRLSILLVALNNPSTKNAFDNDQYEDLIRLLDLVANDDTVDAIVLTGVGDYFTSGADINSFFAIADYVEESKVGDILKTPSARFMFSVISFPKMLVAAVNGPAVGIGVTLLPHCDLVYCTENATFWTPFTRIAIVPEFCSSLTFVATMGLPRANELLLMGKKINAERAYSDKLVSGIIKDCGQSGDAFADDSIGVRVSCDIDDCLLSLSHGEKTAKVFVSLTRSESRRRILEKVCIEEWLKFEKRIRNGEVYDAVAALVSVKTSKL
jgi:peroxisomal 3,2-trans-enoyl-CoA isomerase